MDESELIQSIARRPFVPFRVRLKLGKQIDITDPHSAYLVNGNLLVLHRSGLTEFYLSHYEEIDPRLIESVVEIEFTAKPGTDVRLATSKPFAGASLWLHRFEALLSLLATAATLCVAALMALGLFAVRSRNAPFQNIALLAGWGVLLAAQLYFLIDVLRFYSARIYPMPLLYALDREPPRNRLAAFAMMLVWAVYALVGVFAFTWLEHWIWFAVGNKSGATITIGYLVRLAMILGGAHACSMFVLLSARAAGASTASLKRLWECRIVSDLVLVFLAFATARYVNQAILQIQYMLGEWQRVR